MSSSKKNYIGILKGTAVFGGVQVFNVFVNLIRGKLIALILGTSGMGISSLLFGCSSTIQQISSLGLNTSAMKEISGSHELDDKQHLSYIVCVFRQLVIFFAFLGLLLTLVFKRQLCVFTFGDDSYTWYFIVLSFVVFVNLLANAETTILQGTREYKKIAYSSIVGSMCGLFVGIPLYYFWGNNGIVISMLCLALALFLFNRNSTSKLRLYRVPITLRDLWTSGRTMVSLGGVLVLGSVIGTATNYGLNAFMRFFGTIDDVGLFQAANSITNQYTGMVFAAMAADYFPRLAGSIDKSTRDIRQMVSEEAEIVTLIISPIAILIIMTAPFIIRVLLSSEFLAIVDIVRYMGYMVIFKALCFPLGYVGILKNNKTFYFWTECIWVNLKTFMVFSLFYYIMGLNGLGYAALTSSILDIAVVVPLYKYYFGITFTTNSFILIFKQLFLASIVLAISLNIHNYWGVLLNIFLLLVCLFIVYKELDKRVGIMQLIKTKLKVK